MAKAKGAGSGTYWLLQQHDQFSVVESREQPSLDVEKGERRKNAYGPFKTREEAEKRKEKLAAGTLRTLMGKE